MTIEKEQRGERGTFLAPAIGIAIVVLLFWSGAAAWFGDAIMGAGIERRAAHTLSGVAMGLTGWLVMRVLRTAFRRRPDHSTI